MSEKESPAQETSKPTQDELLAKRKRTYAIFMTAMRWSILAVALILAILAVLFL